MSALRDALRAAGLPINPTENPVFDVVRAPDRRSRSWSPRSFETRHCDSCARLRGVRWFDGDATTCRECEGKDGPR